MAKKKRQRSSAAQTRAGDSANVRLAVRELRDLYRLGLKVLAADKKNPKRQTYSRGISLEFAEQLGVKRDYIDRARTFASTYSQKQFEELCSLRRPDGMPLSRKHISYLLSVKNKNERRRLQRMAAKQGWGTRRLGEEVATVQGSSSSGGRRPRAPESVKGAISQIVKMATSWQRWYYGLESVPGENSPSLDDLPLNVRKRLSEAMKNIAQLKDSAERHLN